MLDRGVKRAGKTKSSDWLALPLCPNHHTGDQGVDSAMGVQTWERAYGAQADMVDEVGQRLGVDNWGLANAEMAQTKIVPRNWRFY